MFVSQLDTLHNIFPSTVLTHHQIPYRILVLDTDDNTVNVRINVTLSRDRATIVVVEKR